MIVKQMNKVCISMQTKVCFVQIYLLKYKNIKKNNKNKKVKKQYKIYGIINRKIMKLQQNLYKLYRQ